MYASIITPQLRAVAGNELGIQPRRIGTACPERVQLVRAGECVPIAVRPNHFPCLTRGVRTVRVTFVDVVRGSPGACALLPWDRRCHVIFAPVQAVRKIIAIDRPELRVFVLVRG